MAGLFVKRDDTVQVIAGKDKGARGKVLVTLPAANRVIVEGVNRVKKHTKVTQTTRGAQTGGIVTQEAAVDASNVQVVCPKCGKPTRIGHRKVTDEESGKTRSVRVCRKCDESF
jgi:large subunit ribosomal protein L24